MTPTLIQAFDARVASSPDATAIVHGRRTVSYRELRASSVAIARRLVTAGAAAGDIVGLAGDRSIEWVVGVLAILRIGGVYLPLPPDLPPERRRLLAREGGVRHVLRHPAVEDDPAVAATVVNLDLGPEPSSDDGHPPDLPDPGRGSDRACVLFTSGTTGTPKGVVIRQSSIDRLVVDTDYVVFTESDVVAFASNTAFDAVTFEVWGALLNGGRLVVIDTATLLSPSALDTVLRTGGVTILFLTTELFNRIARSRPAAFRSVRWLLFGGEKANAGCVRSILGGGGHPAHLVHMYGPTECTTFATYHRVTAVPPDATTVPIGTPISGSEIHLLDDRMRPVPDGEEGEICIAGAGLAEGYLGRPAETAAAFVILPIDGTPTRVYRTGDRARRRADGPIEYVGRRDGQVKLRGFRIETGEIEATLALHPAIREAIALVYPGSGDAPRLGACLLPDAAAGVVDVAAIRAFLAARLPEPMVPARLVVYAAFPLTPSKKVDRQRLRADLGRADRAGGGDAAPGSFTPADGLEKRLAAIWEDLLGHAPRDAEENFFGSGADSLQAVDLQLRIENEWKLALSPSILLEAPTFGRLADHLRRRRTADVQPVVWLTPSRERPVLACVPGVFGHVFFLRNLVPVWPGDRGLCALPSRYLDPDSDRRLLSMEEIAEENLARLAKAGAAPVEAVAGYSFGGLVAYEMAHRMAQDGNPPALILFDTAAVGEQFRGDGRMARSFAPLRRAWRRIRFHGDRLLYHQLLRRGCPVPAKLFNPAELANLEALERYRPRPYDGGMLLVRAADEPPPPGVDPVTMGWDRFVRGPLTVQDVRATHAGLFAPPHVAEVAALTNDYVRRWTADRHRPG